MIKIDEYRKFSIEMMNHCKDFLIEMNENDDCKDFLIKKNDDCKDFAVFLKFLMNEFLDFLIEIKMIV
jgi:hypothetical protein